MQRLSERTRNLMKEVKAPSTCGHSAIQELFEQAIPVLAQAGQQGAEIASRARLAKLSEQDMVVRGRVQPYVETAGAIQRLAQEAELALERLLLTFQQLEACQCQFEEVARERGFEVDSE